MCALVIEDGSSPTGANSYATLVEIRAFALARGVTLSAVDSVVEILAVKAMDYLESLEMRFKGNRTAYDQPLAWPRDNVYLFGSPDMFASDEIPAQLISAQCQLALDALTADLQPTSVGVEVLREKIDVLEVEYAKGSSPLPEPIKALAFLAPLFISASVRTIRV